MEANADSPNAVLTTSTIANLASDPSLLERAVVELIPRLTPESDIVMQRAAVQSVVCLAKHDIGPVFDELVAGLFLVAQGTNDVALQCRCLEALNALHSGRADRMHPYSTRLIPMELMANDDPELAAVFDLDRLMLRAIPPQLQTVSSACLIEGMDLLELLMIAYPQETVEFLQENEAVSEMLIREDVM
jgi:hypothetical protein